jgi:hypothetical protein
MHLKVFVKLKKTLKTLSSGPKNPKKPEKTQKTQKNPKKPTGLGFFKKTRVFSNPAQIRKIESSVADPGCLSRIPDPNFFHPGFRVNRFPDPGPASASKNFRILTKKMVSKLSKMM